MQGSPRIVGKCTELVKGTECGGNIKEDIQDTAPKSPFFQFISGTSRLVGYVCDRCNNKTPLTNPGDTINSVCR